MGERQVKNIAEPVRAYRVVDADDIGDACTLICPYPGMVPFSAADAQHFYGRDEEVKRMVQLLHRQRFMMVIGPSGSGKSSLVYAGLLPELERGRYFAKDYWLIRTMRPGPNPTTALAGVFGGDGGEFEPDSVDALLEGHPPAQRLLLLVDQFEEVFAQAERAEQARFIAALQALRAPENCALILTLRADFYPDLMNSYLWPVDASQRVEVAPLRGESLREAIERPAADVGVRIEGKLVNQLLADAADEPGALPLLQETMRLLWHDVEHRSLPNSAYERLSEGAGETGSPLSGLAVAIAMKADATLAELEQSKQTIARRIFLRLIQFGEGRADTRRQQPVAALHSVKDPTGEFEQTLEHLTAHRLLTRSGGHDNTPPAVDISHESLIDGWSRLQVWADERREAEQIRRRLESKALEWVRLGKGTGGLLDEVALPEAERWLTSADAADLGFDAALPELVAASQQAIDAAQKAREDARQQELRQAAALAEEQRQRIVEQGRSAKRMRLSMLGLAAVFVVAVGSAVFAWTQNQKAQLLAVQEVSAREEAEARRLESEQAREDAEARRVESEQARAESERRRVEAENARLGSIAQLLLIQAPQQQEAWLDERGALLARQAYRFSGTGSRALKEQVGMVLRTVIGKPHFSRIFAERHTRAIAYSPDGTMLAAAHATPSEVVLYDLTQHGAPPVVLPDHPGRTSNSRASDPIGYIFAMTFSPDGKTLIAADAEGRIGQWTLDGLQTRYLELPALGGGVWSVAYSPDGHWMAMGSKRNDSFVLWDLTRTGAGPALVEDPQSAPAGSGPPSEREGGVPVAFSPDSSTLATGSLNGIIRLWRPPNLSTPIASLSGHRGGILALSFSDDGRFLASSGQDATVRLWNPSDLTAESVVLKEGGDPINSLAFDPAGNILATSSFGADGFQLWKPSSPDAPPVVFSATFGFKVGFSPDGKTLAAGGAGSLYLWDLEPSGQPSVLTGQGAIAFAFSPDMTLLASGGRSGDNTIRLWRWDALEAPPAILHGHEGAVNSLEFSADGKRLLSASWNGNSILLWDLAQPMPEPTAVAVPDRMIPWTALFSPDGQSLSATGTGGVRAWSLADLSAESKLVLPTEKWASEMAVSPKGDMLASANLGTAVYLKDISRPDMPALELVGHSGPKGSYSVAFSPDGHLLASGGNTDASVRLWRVDPPDAASIVFGRHNEGIVRVRFSPDGKQLASASEDRTVRLWQVEDPSALPIILSGHQSGVWAMEYSHDGKYLVTGASKTIRVWDLTHPLNHSTTRELADMACRKVWRNLTLAEWHKFVGLELPFERTCPNLPLHPSLFEAAERMAKENDLDGAVALLERAVELDPELDIDPEAEARKLAESDAKETQ